MCVGLAAGFLLSMLLTAASWLHGDPATNDFERFHDLRLTGIFFVLLGIASGAFVAAVEARLRPRPRTLWLGFVLLALPLLASFPVGSRDVFAYVFSPKMWFEHGANPYLVPPSAHADDPWYPMLQAWWTGHTTTYGPLCTLLSRVLLLAGNFHLGGAVAAWKILNLALVALSGWLMVRLRSAAAAGSTPEGCSLFLWLWCPLVLFEALVSAHNDVGMVLLLQLAALAWLRRRWVMAGACLAASFWFKFYTVLLMPLWFVWWWRRSGGNVRREVALAAVGAGAVSLAVLLPFADELGPVLAGLGRHELSGLAFPTEMPPPVRLLFEGLRSRGLMDSPRGWVVFGASRLGFFAMGLAWLALRRRGQSFEASAFLGDCFRSLLLFVLLVPAVLYPWHLLPVVAFALTADLQRPDLTVAGLSTVGLFSYFLTWTWALAGCFLALAALSWMRRFSPFVPLAR